MMFQRGRIGDLADIGEFKHSFGQLLPRCFAKHVPEDRVMISCGSTKLVRLKFIHDLLPFPDYNRALLEPLKRPKDAV